MIYDPESYAAIYARQSNLSEKIDSTGTQLAIGQRTAVDNNLLIYKNYDESISATEIPFMERKKFRELVADARAGYFKTIIVSKHDRLARNSQDFSKIKDIFKNLGIKILYSSKGEFQPDGTPTSDFIENIIASIAELEPNLIKQRTEAGRKRKRESNEYSPGGHIPYGLLSKDGPNKDGTKTIQHYFPDESKKDFITELFTHYTNNENIISSTDLYESLVKDNINIPEDFNKDNIRSLLLNPTYAKLQTKDSKLKLKDTLIKNKAGEFTHIDRSLFQPPYNLTEIVDDKTWYSAANKWFINHNPFKSIKRTTDYIFKDILYCKKCGKKISLSGNIYTCGTKKCFREKKESLTSSILSKLITDMMSDDKLHNRINFEIQKLNLKVKSKKLQLVNLAQSEETLITQYLSNKNEYLIHSLETNTQKQDAVKKEIKNTNFNINFLQNIKSFSHSNIDMLNMYFLIEHMKTKYYLTQKFLNTNIEKVILDGHNPRIEYKEN